MVDDLKCALPKPPLPPRARRMRSPGFTRSAKIPTLFERVSGQQSSVGAWGGTPTSQTGVACVPSGKLLPAPAD